MRQNRGDERVLNRLGLAVFAVLASGIVTLSSGGVVADTPDAPPPEVTALLSPVRDSAWATGRVKSIMNGLKDDQTKLVVLNRTIAGRIEHLSEHPGKLPDRDIWDLRSGWCDNVARLFVTLARAAGYPARVVALTHTDGANGHVVAEAYYDGKWHLFDPDHGVEYYLEDASIAGAADLLLDQSPVTAIEDPWRGNNGVGMEGFFVTPSAPSNW